MSRTREDVWTLTRAEGDWPAVLAAYDRAVAVMRGRDPQTGPPSAPLGWRYQAAMHGLAAADGTADTSDPLWSNCQHGSWYFLAWHRMYLRAFELVVQDAVGDDWALPYWYAVDPDDPAKSVLPPAFRDPSRNLHTNHRSVTAKSGRRLPDLGRYLIDALEADVFSTSLGTSTFGGGERSTPSFDGHERGLLENVPHGSVHGYVGNDYDAAGNVVREGWMGSFYTAALDPIFWLHHANIDRLWQVWLDLDPTHRNPPDDDPAWADATFSFPKVGGGLHTWRIGDVLDTGALDYRYESTAPPSALAVPAGVPGDIALGEVPVPEPLSPQVIGAAVDVPLATAEAVDVGLSEPSDIGLGASADAVGAGRMFLRVEGVTGTAGAPVYEIYLNVPAGDEPAQHPELRAGAFSTFGLAESSQRDDVHVGAGLTTVFDVTAVRDVLAEQGRWDPGRLQVSFSPVTPPATVEAADLDEPVQPRTADMRASQIAVSVA
jgi:tyrosinase